MSSGANRWTKRGLVIGTFGTMLAFVAIHIDRIVAEPQGIDATAQAAAQSTRLNIYGAIMIVSAVIAVISGIRLAVRQRRR